MRRKPPVLCYHRIGGPLELGVTRVGRSVFARQMTALARAGWRTLSLNEFSHPRTTHHAPRTFLLTFDDGYASLAEHAYPVLADLGFTATTFLITDYVGKTNTWDVQYTWQRLKHLSWPEIEHWQVREFDFASHGATHQRLTWLSIRASSGMPGPPATSWDSQESREVERHSSCRGCRSTSGMRAMCRLDCGMTLSVRLAELLRMRRIGVLWELR